MSQIVSFYMSRFVSFLVEGEWFEGSEEMVEKRVFGEN